MDPSSTGARKPPRGIYLLPNLFTTGAMFAGFYAIVAAIGGRYVEAAIAVFVAGILDGLDGRVARLSGTQSEFGVQYDSLSDMVSFGAAPALVMYEWALRPMEKLGWIAAFVYVAGAALRLARFNTNIDVVDKRFFQGLPSPAAAAIVAGFVWVSQVFALTTEAERWVGLVITLYAGLTMVTNVSFYSFKTINLKRSIPFVVLLACVLGLALLSLHPPLVLFIGFVAYGISGYVYSGWRMVRKSRPVN